MRWSAPVGFRYSPFLCGLLSGLLMFFAYPPFGLWPLAFAAPSPLVWLARKQAALPGPRPYVWIWIGYTIGWLALLQGIRLPHWILYFGWITLSVYVASYGAIFVFLCRVATQRFKCPLWIVAPLIWVGLEFFRAHFATGFAVGLSSHPLIACPQLTQIAEFGGAYAVSLVVALAAASLAMIAPRDETTWKPWPVIPLTIAIGATWIYGDVRLRQLPVRKPASGDVTIALLQAAQNVVFEDSSTRSIELFQQCNQQAIAARRAVASLDLIVWPESTFSANRRDVIVDGDPRPSSSDPMSKEDLAKALSIATDAFQEHVGLASEAMRDGDPNCKTQQLVGGVTVYFGEHEPELMNSALLLGPFGDVNARYHKSHRVMFGEYVPLGDQMPWIYDWTPLQRGLTAGSEPMAFELNGVRLAPNICFESTVPHLVRRQFNQLHDQNETPDALINQTNDGWFWGSAILDLHFACSVFRAIEMRRPVLIAANTGVTAWVDDAGRVIGRADRGEQTYVVAHIGPSRVARSVYATYGDWPALLCSLLAGLLAIYELGIWWAARQAKRQAA